MASISNSMDVENDDNNNNNHANLATRYEDVHVKLIDLKIPNIIPLKTETEIPSWALKSTEFLTICGTLHDYLITSLVHDKEIRNLQHASKSFNAVLLLFKLRGSPYPLSNPKPYYIYSYHPLSFYLFYINQNNLHPNNIYFVLK